MTEPNHPKAAGPARLPRPYDVQMIRDFLQQLLLELRLQREENARRAADPEGPRGADESLLAQLGEYRQKYACHLLERHAVDPGGAPEGEVQEAVLVLSGQIARLRAEQLGKLESLGELFDEALACVLVSRGTDAGRVVQPVSRRRASAVLQGRSSPTARYPRPGG